jgi:MoaA/NifB/PqqE/SkfB family radical SAM enzyme
MHRAPSVRWRNSQAEMQGLRDGFGRRIDYLRLSVTDRCDLRCAYCMRTAQTVVLEQTLRRSPCAKPWRDEFRERPQQIVWVMSSTGG